MSDFETKYIANNLCATKAKAWLDLNFQRDPDFPGTIISSVYFDTKKLDYLHEKLESDHIKSKFRIRWYEDLQTKKASDICFLEFKHKIGENRHKKRIKAQNIYSDKELESSIFANSLDELRSFEGSVLHNIHPSYTISYTRFRYIIPGTEMRLCIDYDINVKRVNSFLLHKPIKQKYLSQCVFELKGETAVLPKELSFMERLGFHKNAFSKYERCYEELLN